MRQAHKKSVTAVILISCVVILCSLLYNSQSKKEATDFLLAWEEQGQIAQQLLSENYQLCVDIMLANTDDVQVGLLKKLQAQYYEITGYLYCPADADGIAFSRLNEGYDFNGIHIFDVTQSGIMYNAYLIYHPAGEIHTFNDEYIAIDENWAFYKQSIGGT